MVRRILPRELPAPLLAPAALLLVLLRSGGFLAFASSDAGRFTAASLLSLLRHLVLEPAAVFLFFAGCARLGEALWRRHGPACADGAMRFLFALPVGLGAVSFLIMFCGLAGALRPALCWAVFAPLAAWGAFATIRRPPAFGRLKPAEFAALLVGAYLIVSGCVLAGAPPTDWDTLAYHLTLPKLFLRAGNVSHIPWAIASHFPLNTEMLNIIGLGLGSDTFPQVVNCAFAAAFLSAVFLFGRRYLTMGAGVLAVAVLATQPAALRIIGNCKTDYALALPTFLCVWAILEGRRSGDRRWFYVSALLAGLSASAKFSGLWTGCVWASLMALHLYTTPKDRGWRFAAALALIATAASPWYLRNLWLYGNPVWPYMGDFFGAVGRDATVWDRIRQSVTEGVPKTPGNLLLLPWHLLSRPETFKYEPQYLTVFFIATALFGGWRLVVRDPALRWTALFCAGFAAIWFFMLQDWRYLIPALAFGALLASEAWLGAWRKGGVLVRVALAGLLAYVVAPIAEVEANNAFFAVAAPTPPAGSDLSSRDYFLGRAWGPYPMFYHMNTALPATAKVLFYREGRNYYMNRPYALGGPFELSAVDYDAVRDADDLYERLNALGFTHVLDNPDVGVYQGDRRYYERIDSLVQEMLRRHAGREARMRGLSLYRLRPSRRQDMQP